MGQKGVCAGPLDEENSKDSATTVRRTLLANFVAHHSQGNHPTSASLSASPSWLPTCRHSKRARPHLVSPDKWSTQAHHSFKNFGVQTHPITLLTGMYVVFCETKQKRDYLHTLHEGKESLSVHPIPNIKLVQREFKCDKEWR